MKYSEQQAFIIHIHDTNLRSIEYYWKRQGISCKYKYLAISLLPTSREFFWKFSGNLRTFSRYWEACVPRIKAMAKKTPNHTFLGV